MMGRDDDVHVHPTVLGTLFCIFINANGSSTVNVVVIGRHDVGMKGEGRDGFLYFFLG